MTRIPRVCLVLVVTALLVLLMAPVAGARTVSSPSAHHSESGWIGAALHWVEELAGLRPQGHRPPSIHRKDGALGGSGGGTIQPTNGTCINPDGSTNPLCHFGGV